MKSVASSIEDLIGNTPMISLKKYCQLNKLSCNIIAKLEYFNPAGSIKDRVALAFILDAEKRGILKKGFTIIEPTSGNTGIGLAAIGSSRGYQVILTMPNTMSHERITLLKNLGASVVLTPGDDGMSGAIKKAYELKETMKNSFMPNQFSNPVNSQIHTETTAKEVLNDTQGEIDIFVCGVGSGGTLTGVASVLKKYNPNIKIIAVEPESSAVLSNGLPGKHNIQGIGAGFIPETCRVDLIDEIVKVTDDNAFKTVKELSLSEGIFAGISSGAALFASTLLAKRFYNTGKNIVTIFPDSGERYLSILEKYN